MIKFTPLKAAAASSSSFLKLYISHTQPYFFPTMAYLQGRLKWLRDRTKNLPTVLISAKKYEIT